MSPIGTPTCFAVRAALSARARHLAERARRAGEGAVRCGFDREPDITENHANKVHDSCEEMTRHRARAIAVLTQEQPKGCTRDPPIHTTTLPTRPNPHSGTEQGGKWINENAPAGDAGVALHRAVPRRELARIAQQAAKTTPVVGTKAEPQTGMIERRGGSRRKTKITRMNCADIAESVQRARKAGWESRQEEPTPKPQIRPHEPCSRQVTELRRRPVQILNKQAG